MPTTNTVHATKLKAQAKQLLKAARVGDPKAVQKIAPYFDDPRSLKLTQAQLVVARSLNFSSWRKLMQKQDWLACSFCKKWQYELNKLIAGSDAYVCDECVEICNEIIRQDKQASC